MKRVGILSLLLLLSLPAFAQKMPLSAFKDSILPKAGAGDLYDVTQSPYRFEVSIVHDSLTVTLNNDSTTVRPAVLPLGKGQLTGYDYGEFGGYMIHTSSTGKTDTIFRGPVRHIFTCYGRIFFTSGLWHMSQHYGQLYQLDTAKGQFKSKIYSTFDYPIRQCHVTRDSMYLVSYGTLYRMQYGKPVVVTALPFVCTSIATRGRFMYFGMRGGYARYDMKLKQFRYFVYTDQ